MDIQVFKRMHKLASELGVLRRWLKATKECLCFRKSQPLQSHAAKLEAEIESKNLVYQALRARLKLPAHKARPTGAARRKNKRNKRKNGRR